MNAIDILWQHLLDEACENWKTRPADELRTLAQFTSHKFKSGTDEIEYALWHENPSQSPDQKSHSFVLQTGRKLGLFSNRNYLAGFSLDESGAIIPIADEIIAHYD